MAKTNGVPKVVARYDHFYMKRMPRKKGRKTHKYDVINNNRDDLLGVIKWYSNWRQFCLFTHGGDIIWSEGCLADVQEFLNDLRTNRSEYEEAPSAG